MTECKCACNKQFSILAGGPQQREIRKEILQTMQVGGPQLAHYRLLVVFIISIPLTIPIDYRNKSVNSVKYKTTYCKNVMI
ncbi:hypothetical protein CKX94_10410 [Staphylococcus argenteus]|nr:hypothetical protein CKX94_10410 [Staphylococcus argenteus]